MEWEELLEPTRNLILCIGIALVAAVTVGAMVWTSSARHTTPSSPPRRKPEQRRRGEGREEPAGTVGAQNEAVETPPLDYCSSRATPSRRAVRVAVVLVGVQVLWLYPAVLGVFVLLCNNQLVRDPLANFAGAAVVVAPSLVAAPLAAGAVLRRRHSERGEAALAACALTGALGFTLYVFAGTVYDLLHPGLLL